MPTPTLLLDTTISLMIDEEHEWNETLSMQHFTPKDADHISKIMLSRSLRPD